MLLSEFFETVYCPLRLLNRSNRTKILYRYSIRLFGHTLGHEPTLADLQDLTVARHLERLIADGRSPAGVNKERAQLIAIWNLAAKKRLVQDFPHILSVHQPERIPEAWSIDELWRLKMSCNMQRGEYAGVPASLWWVCLHHVLFDTGERITAVLSAKFSDIMQNKIVFPAENRKGSKRANVCELSQSSLDLIELARRPTRQLIFPWTYSQTYLYRLYNEILDRAELDKTSRSKFHRMRRSHATHLKKAGGDPTRSLGHQNPATTSRYIDPRFLDTNTVELLPDFGVR